MNALLSLLASVLEYVVIFGGTLLFLLNALVTGHILLNKDNTRAATGWIGLIWFSPLAGHVLYFLLGINRIERKARRKYGTDHADTTPLDKHILNEGDERVNPSSLARIIHRVSGRELTDGNRITPLVNGDEAYPEMLEVIQNSERSITLCSYIFDNDAVGDRFVSALGDAVDRNVSVRVLIDDVGARHSFPSVSRKLTNRDVPVAHFMETWFPWKFRYLNLRNHRKIMVADGTIGFTGGLNISGEYQLNEPGESARDLHFRVEGPVVNHLQNTFSEDWAFATGEELEGEPWYTDIQRAGDVPARGIAAGPDETYDNLRMAFLGALSSAEASVQIITPYFLPDDELISAIHLASLRSVDVEIFLPEENNPRLVQWASSATLEHVLKYDCDVYETPPPFDHSKLLVVDDRWVTFGSTNWDPRSLKLNFEFNVECYDRELATELQPLFDDRRAEENQLTLDQLQNRALITRLRDRAVRLLSPYL